MDCTTGVTPLPIDLIKDGWSEFKASIVLVSTPDDTLKRDTRSIPALVDRINDIDLPRQDRICARVDSIV